MAEGGLLYWKMQKINQKPTTNYSEVHHSLPEPPKGMMWKKDEISKEWSLCEKESKEVEEWELVDTEVKKVENEKDSCKNKEEIPELNYVEHIILPTDTLAGICLAYKVSATKIRQMNGFSGSNLLLAPKKLRIPLKDSKILSSGTIRVQNKDSPEFKIHSLIHAFPDMSLSEAKAYMEICEWKLDEAIQSAREDRDWEYSQLSNQKNIHDHKVHVEVHEGVPLASVSSAQLRKLSHELELSPLL